MDPEARKFMWTVVARIAEKKSSAVVLTTHSMDEAEALSTKMGIMVKGGRFKCIGSSQHIKDKFGTGFLIELKIRDAKDSELWPLVQRHFGTESEEFLFDKTTPFDEKIISLITSQLKKQRANDLYRKVHNLTNLYGCIYELCMQFNEVELIE